MKSIYDLHLHESMEVQNTTPHGWRVRRVPNGWIYTALGPQQHSVFVPFDKEFMYKNTPDSSRRSNGR